MNDVVDMAPMNGFHKLIDVAPAKANKAFGEV